MIKIFKRIPECAEIFYFFIFNQIKKFKQMKRTLIILLMCSFVTAAYSGKKPLIEGKDEVTEAATKELSEQMNAPEGVFYLFKTEHNIRGEYMMDITVHDKGTVASVFVAGREGGDIQSQNKVKDFVKDYEFGFKLPKGKKYKFQFIFKFD